MPSPGRAAAGRQEGRGGGRAAQPGRTLVYGGPHSELRLGQWPPTGLPGRAAQRGRKRCSLWLDPVPTKNSPEVRDPSGAVTWSRRSLGQREEARA